MRLIEKIKVSAIGRVTTSILLGVTFLLAVTLPYTPLAMSTGDTICGDVAPLTTETISEGIFDNVIVPSPSADISGKCKLEGSVVVQGNVVVEPSADLHTSGVAINGNVKGESGSVLVIDESFVGGDVHGERGSDLVIDESFVGDDVQGERGLVLVIDDSFVGGNVLTKEMKITVKNSFVGANIQIESSSVGSNVGPIEIELVGTYIGGNVQLINNKNSLQDILVNNNNIGSNLQLTDNMGTIMVTNNNVGDSLQLIENTGTPKLRIIT